MNKLIGITALVLVLGFIAITLISSVSYRDETIRLQNGVSANYDNNRQILAGVARRIETKVGVANIDLDKLSQLFTNVSGARYHDPKGGSSTADATKTGTVFSAIHEAYPTVDASMYQDIIKEVDVQEDKFANAQTGLRDSIRNFDDHTQTTWNSILNSLPWNHFPNDNLTALGPNGTTLHGKAALDQMRKLVTSKESDKAYQTNEFDGPQLPNN